MYVRMYVRASTIRGRSKRAIGPLSPCGDGASCAEQHTTTHPRMSARGSFICCFRRDRQNSRNPRHRLTGLTATIARPMLDYHTTSVSLEATPHFGTSAVGCCCIRVLATRKFRCGSQKIPEHLIYAESTGRVKRTRRGSSVQRSFSYSKGAVPDFGGRFLHSLPVISRRPCVRLPALTHVNTAQQQVRRSSSCSVEIEGAVRYKHCCSWSTYVEHVHRFVER